MVQAMSYGSNRPTKDVAKQRIEDAMRAMKIRVLQAIPEDSPEAQVVLRELALLQAAVDRELGS